MLSVLIIAVSACDRTVRPAQNVLKPSAEPAASAPVQPTNGTGLAAQRLESPLAELSVRFAAPGFGERIDVAAPRVYEVRLELDAAEPAPSHIELALDAGRPRRLQNRQMTSALGQLLAPGEVLSPGEHWLFAAPVLASGLVPRPRDDRPRAAIARRFSIGGARGSSSSGVIWIRKPEGTYNGPQSAGLVLFDAYAFARDGAVSELTPTLFLRGPGLGGELQLAAPFALAELPSGEYEVRASAPACPEVSSRFTVNRELESRSDSP